MAKVLTLTLSLVLSYNGAIAAGFPCDDRLDDYAMNLAIRIVAERHHQSKRVRENRVRIMTEAATGEFALGMEGLDSTVTLRPQDEVIASLKEVKISDQFLIRGIEDDATWTLGNIINFESARQDLMRGLEKAKAEKLTPDMSKEDLRMHASQIQILIKSLLSRNTGKDLFKRITKQKIDFRFAGTQMLVKMLLDLSRLPQQKALKQFSDFANRIAFDSISELLQPGGFFDTASELNFILLQEAIPLMQKGHYADRFHLTKRQIQLLDRIPKTMDQMIPVKVLDSVTQELAMDMRDQAMASHIAALYCHVATDPKRFRQKTLKVLLGVQHLESVKTLLKKLADPVRLEISSEIVEVK